MSARVSGHVRAVAREATHRFSKSCVAEIRLVAGQGVAGDAHAGEMVKHRSRVRVDPTQPNLRQVHLLHAELFEELRRAGVTVTAGDLGENITTQGLDLLALPRGTLLEIGEAAVVEVTGLRNPCAQIDRFEPGLLAHVLKRGPRGELIRKAGIMGVVISGGAVRPGQAITARLPAPPHLPLDRV